MWSSLTPAVDRPGAGEAELRAKIPADVDAPDRLAFDLTFRQLTVLVMAGLTGLMLWSLLARTVPMAPAAARALVLVPVAGAALALAVGRRDGLSLDAWLLAAVLFRHRPHRLVPVEADDPPGWAPMVAPSPDASGSRSGRGSRGGSAEPVVSLLRLPADALDPDGTVHHRSRSTSAGSASAAVLVAATTVNVTLRTPAEQAGLVAGLGRWLNGLTTRVQIVVSTRRVDLPAHAVRIADRAHELAGAFTDESDDDSDGDARAGGWVAGGVSGFGLTAAALDHAEFLLDLAERLDPLARTVTITATATGGPSPATVARRTADHTVSALTALGAAAVVLDGPAATAVLTAATDPYQAGDASWTRTPPDAVVTGRPPGPDPSDAGTASRGARS